MNKLRPLIILVTVVISISTIAQTSRTETLKEFVKDVVQISKDDLEEGNLIHSFNDFAKEKAAKTIVLTKENIQASLKEAKDYKYMLVTVGKHTIVKVTDMNNCRQSGAWASCMPYGDGYILKGTMNAKSDYINNIIGIPDVQIRYIFLFK